MTTTHPQTQVNKITSIEIEQQLIGLRILDDDGFFCQSDWQFHEDIMSSELATPRQGSDNPVGLSN